MINIPKRFRKMPAGEYVCRIKRVEIAPNRFGDSCLWVYLDVDSGKFKNYFTNIYENRKNRGNNIYPCVYCQSMSNYSIRFFKMMLKSIIASNPDYVCTCEDGKDWNEQELENLIVGVVFEERQFTNKRGRIQVNLVPARFKDANLINNEVEANLINSDVEEVNLDEIKVDLDQIIDDNEDLEKEEYFDDNDSDD